MNVSPGETEGSAPSLFLSKEVTYSSAEGKERGGRGGERRGEGCYLEAIGLLLVVLGCSWLFLVVPSWLLSYLSP